MQSSAFRTAFFATLAATTLFSGCGSADDAPVAAFDSSAGLLRFVPADTPYLIATPGDVPDEVMDKLEPYLDEVLRNYHSILRATLENAYAEARDDDADLEAYERMLPVVDELKGLMSVAGLRKAGIERNADIAVYGIGLLPVGRLSLSDGALLDSVIARMEQEADQELSVATVGGTSYRYVDNDNARLIVALIDNDLVVTVVPAGIEEDQLKQVLGLTLPARNIAATDRLTDVAKSYGFSDYMIGIVDFERIAATFLDAQSGINAELLSLMEYDHAVLSDVCKAEIKTLVGTMPRLVMGYTEMTTNNINSRMVFELRSDIAASVAKLTGSVPGLSDARGGLMSIGASSNLLELRNFYSARLDALDADPFECELLDDVQDMSVSGREWLSQPIPPVAYSFKGFLAVVDNIEGMELATGQPPTSVDMRLLLSMDNAQALLAMGAMFSPELAGLNVAANGEPVRLEMSQLAATGMDVHVAMTDNAIGFSVGDGMQLGLKDMLNADATEAGPFLVVDMDAKRYYQLVGEAMAAQAGSNDAIPEIQEAAKAITLSAGKLIDRARLVVNFTGNGVEIESEMKLAK